MPTHSYLSHGMATLNYRAPPAATAPSNSGQGHHHQRQLPTGVPKSVYGMYGVPSNIVAPPPMAGSRLQQYQQPPQLTPFNHHQHIQHLLHQQQQSAGSVVYASTSTAQLPQAPPPAPIPAAAPPAADDEDDDFLSEITVQFDDEVQTLYVGPVEIIDNKGGGGGEPNTKMAASKNGGLSVSLPATKPRERIQEERAIVTLEPIGAKAKSQPLPMYLQQQHQLQQAQHQLHKAQHQLHQAQIKLQKQKTKQHNKQQQRQQELMRLQHQHQQELQRHKLLKQQQQQQQLRIQQQALLQHMNLINDYSLQRQQQQQAPLESLTELQLKVSLQQNSSTQPAYRPSSNSRPPQQLPALFQQPHQLVQARPQPPVPQQPRPKMCVKQAPMLNFALHNAPGITGNGGKRPAFAGMRAAEKPSLSVSEMMTACVSEMIVQAATSSLLARSPAPQATPTHPPVVSLLTEQATVVKVPAKLTKPAKQQTPQQPPIQQPVLLTQLKQEPVSSEHEQQEHVVEVQNETHLDVPPVERKPSLTTMMLIEAAAAERTVLPQQTAGAAALGVAMNGDDSIAAIPAVVPTVIQPVSDAAVNKRRSANNDATGERPQRAEEAGGSGNTGVEVVGQTLQQGVAAQAKPPVNISATVDVQQPVVIVKRGRGRPPKSAQAKSLQLATAATKLSTTISTNSSELVKLTQASTSANLEGSFNANLSHADDGGDDSPERNIKLNETGKKKGYISVTALFASPKKGRKQQAPRSVTQSNKKSPTVHEPVVADEANSAAVASTPVNAAENKTDREPATIDANTTGNVNQQLVGLDNVQEEIKSGLPLAVLGEANTREGSVVSGDGGESSASSSGSSSVEDGAAIAKPLSDSVEPEQEKESSPASDSGIESVNETTTKVTGSKKRTSAGRPKSSLSPVKPISPKERQEEKDQKFLRTSNRKSISIAESEVDDYGGEEHSRAAKRTVRATRKPSAKAKEAAEAAEVVQNVALSIGGEFQCPKCDMSFKTEMWYKKHLMNLHGIDLVQVAHFFSNLANIDGELLPPVQTETEAQSPLLNGVNADGLEVNNDVEGFPTGDAAGVQDEDETHAEVPCEPEMPLAKTEHVSKATGSRKRKSTHSTEAHKTLRHDFENEERSSPVDGLMLETTTNVKVEYRPSGVHTRNVFEPDNQQTDESVSQELNAELVASKLTQKRGSTVTPTEIVEDTKQEQLDPDEPDKLSPFEMAKVDVIESETTGETHYMCTICGGQFTDKSAIKDHLTAVHAAIKRRSCMYCGRTFVQTGDLTRHVRIHTGQRPFKCPVVECSFAFISSGDLHKHVRRHNTQPLPKPHVCEQCGKDFERSYDLKRHKTMHAKSAPDFKGITCEVCGKVFARRDQFRAHTYRHIGYRPYQCEICGKAFTDPSNYSKHARLHEMDGVEVVCNFCGRPFKNKSAISKHIFHCRQKSGNRKGSSKRGGNSKKKNGSSETPSKKNRRVGAAIGFGKDGSGKALKLKEENMGGEETVAFLKHEQQEQLEADIDDMNSMTSAGARIKERLQATRKRKKRRQRTPSSTEEDDDDDDDDDENEESEDDFYDPRISGSSLGDDVWSGSGSAVRRRRSKKSTSDIIEA